MCVGLWVGYSDVYAAAHLFGPEPLDSYISMILCVGFLFRVGGVLDGWSDLYSAWYVGLVLLIELGCH